MAEGLCRSEAGDAGQPLGRQNAIGQRTPIAATGRSSTHGEHTLAYLAARERAHVSRPPSPGNQALTGRALEHGLAWPVPPRRLTLEVAVTRGMQAIRRCWWAGDRHAPDSTGPCLRRSLELQLGVV